MLRLGLKMDQLKKDKLVQLEMVASLEMDQLKEDRLFLQEMLRRLGLEIDQLMEDRLVQVDMNGMKLQKMDLLKED